MNFKRFYPKKKINYQTNDFVRPLNLEKLNQSKWSFLKLKRPQNFKTIDQSLKFEKKWLRRRYNEELRIKQALKFYYGPLREKNFRKYLLLSLNNKTKQNSQEILVQKLELRLDTFLKRSNIFNSIFASRQNILHKKIWLCKPNEIRFNLIRKANYQVEIGDLFKIKSNVKLVNSNFPQRYFKIFEKNNFIYLLITKQPKLTDVNFTFKLNLKEILNWGRRY